MIYTHTRRMYAAVPIIVVLAGAVPFGPALAVNTPTVTPTATPTSCYGASPVVKPLPAQTDQLQVVTYFCGRIAGSSSMSACSEAGCASDVSFGFGDPSCSVSCLATCNKGTVPLLPGQTNHLTVCQQNGSCAAGGCVSTDLNGAPLDIVQVAPTFTPTPTNTPTATPTSTPTSCYGASPVVKPLPAQTDQLQVVAYFCGRIVGSSSMTACSEAGCASDVSFGFGDPNCTVGCLATCNKGTVPLLPGKINHLTVCQENGSCAAGGCVSTDFNGDPLDIVQVAPTSTPTSTGTPTATPTPTPTSCYGASPVVKPLPAQTDQLQVVAYFCGRIAGSSSMSACSEAGCASDVSFGFGDPNCTVSCLATCNKGTVPLLPGKTNHLTVCQQNGSCAAGGCVSTDLNGAPLEIVQITPTSTRTATLTPTSTPTSTPSCAPTGTPYCSDECVPCPTIRPFCPASVCGYCIQNPTCAAGEVRVCHDPPPFACCACATPTPAWTPTPTPTPTLTCVGDCDGNGKVTISEVVTMVDIVLGTVPFSACTPGAGNTGSDITIDELITAVNNAPNGCSVSPTPSSTPDLCPSDLSVTPSAATPGTLVTVSGRCYYVHSGRPANIFFDDTLVATTYGDTGGDYTVGFTVPVDAAVGAHTVRVKAFGQLIAAGALGVLSPGPAPTPT